MRFIDLVNGISGKRVNREQELEQRVAHLEHLLETTSARLKEVVCERDKWKGLLATTETEFNKSIEQRCRLYGELEQAKSERRNAIQLAENERNQRLAEEKKHFEALAELDEARAASFIEGDQQPAAPPGFQYVRTVAGTCSPAGWALIAKGDQ